MALTRLNDFNAGTVLTEAKLEGEFDRIYSNALALISPLTGNLAAGGVSITGLALGSASAPALSFTSSDTDTGMYSSAADTVDFASGADRALSLNAATGTGATYVAITPGATAVAPIIAGAGETNTGVTLRSAGTGTTTLSAVGAGSVVVSTDAVTRTTFDASGLTMGTNQPIIPATVSGVPAQHGLFRENVVKGWCRADSAQNISDSFNVSGILDNGLGDITVTWDRDFANSTYVNVATVQHDVGQMTWRIDHIPNAPAAGSARFRADINGTASDPQLWNVLAIGDQ